MNLSSIALVLPYIALISSVESIENKKEANGEVKDPKAGKVIGGRDAIDGERPFQIVLLENDVFACGGSLIYPKIVLTAAHCVYGKLSENLKIRYNTLKRSIGPTIQVKKIISHPNFNGYSADNDIAILVLSTAFISGKNAKTISIIPYFDPSTGSTVTASGWGQTSILGGQTENLKVANFTVVDRNECRKIWTQVLITTNMICAIHPTNSICFGDSGGSLTEKTLTHNTILVGIPSFVSPLCLERNFPNVYTRVSDYYYWIIDIVSRES